LIAIQIENSIFFNLCLFEFNNKFAFFFCVCGGGEVLFLYRHLNC